MTRPARLPSPNALAAGGLLAAALAAALPAAAFEGAPPTSPSRRTAPGLPEGPGGVHNPATGAVDPVARLRERLADRLSGVKANTTGTRVDLQVVSVPPASHAGAPGAAAAPRARAATPGGAHGGTGSRHWSYAGEAGPQAWGGLRPEFSLCAKGERQSPIDLRDGLPVDLEPVPFEYRAGAFAVIDNGHTVQVNVAPGNFMELGGRRYELQQFHFHRPSEERIDGRQFEMSVHLVHKDPEGRLAVVAVLLGKGAAQPVLQTVWANLPLEKHQEVKARATLDPAALLPTDRRYYTYMGSLTTPPCTEGVQWVVMRTPVSVAAEQVELFSKIYPMNARPVQSASGRRILQSP